MYKLISVLVICSLGQTSLLAQAPALPARATLSETLLTNKAFTNSIQEDTVRQQHSLPAAYTLEVVARVNTATGRGMDIEARNGLLNGFRLSLDAANLKYTAPLSTATAWTTSGAGKEYTIRVAVQNDSAHIYQNGAYIQSQPLAQIKDIAGGVEIDTVVNTGIDSSLIPNWAGIAPNNTGKPSDYGWLLNPASSTLFAVANSTVAGTSRYLDVNAASGSNLHTYNGATYTGRILFVRWDGSYSSTVYSYPVQLEAGATYDFSLLYAYISNGTAGSAMSVGIGTTTAVSGRIATQTLTTSTTARELKKKDFIFTAPASGTFYITFTGPTALYSIAALSVRPFVSIPRLVFGKNYPTGAVDMQLVSVTYDSGAYAPAGIVTDVIEPVTVTGNMAAYLPVFNTNFVVPGKTDLHLTGDYSPLVNATVTLNSNDAWLFFDNIPPATVTANWLDKVIINGASAANNPAVRVAIYKNGSAVIPNGNMVSQTALTVFNLPGLAGDSNSYEVVTYHNSLGVFNNTIRSFKLCRGYMATMANNSDGSGYSRVFIANDSDLIVSTMPQGLDATVSFIRVFPWDWVSKKGKAGWDPGKLNGTWYYDWNIGGSSTTNYNYVSIRQNGGWPSWSSINNKAGVNHVLGFNEPDQTNQANLTVDQCVSYWPAFMQSGYRIGSPAPASPESSWITNFLAKTDSLNYRVDYVAIHCYWGGQTPSQWYSRLKAIYDRVKRPLWITEWNNGANWTTETWPTDTVLAFQKQLNDIKGILQVLDTASFIERYAEYDWVEYKRSLVLADTLTPAGKYYKANRSDFAYRSAKAFVHAWKLVGPPLSNTINSDDSFKTTLTFTDMNGETGSLYTLERWIDGRDTGFVAINTFSGYAVGSTLSFVDSVFNKATYRVKAYATDGVTYTYGRSLVITGNSSSMLLARNPIQISKLLKRQKPAFAGLYKSITPVNNNP